MVELVSGQIKAEPEGASDLRVSISWFILSAFLSLCLFTWLMCGAYSFRFQASPCGGDITFGKSGITSLSPSDPRLRGAG